MPGDNVELGAGGDKKSKALSDGTADKESGGKGEGSALTATDGANAPTDAAGKDESEKAGGAASDAAGRNDDSSFWRAPKEDGGDSAQANQGKPAGQEENSGERGGSAGERKLLRGQISEDVKLRTRPTASSEAVDGGDKQKAQKEVTNPKNHNDETGFWRPPKEGGDVAAEHKQSREEEAGRRADGREPSAASTERKTLRTGISEDVDLNARFINVREYATVRTAEDNLWKPDVTAEDPRWRAVPWAPWQKPEADLPPEQRRTTEKLYDGALLDSDRRVYADPLGAFMSDGIRPEGADRIDKKVFYVNGIDTDMAGHFHGCETLSRTTGAAVIGIHNSTEGRMVDYKGFYDDVRDITKNKYGVDIPDPDSFPPLKYANDRDVWQSATDKLGAGDNEAAWKVAEVTRYALENDLNVNLVGASQGALIVSRGMRQAEFDLRLAGWSEADIKQKLQEHVTVTTLGGAAYTYPEGPNYIGHYVNRADVVPGLVGLNVERFPREQAEKFMPETMARDVDRDLPLPETGRGPISQGAGGPIIVSDDWINTPEGGPDAGARHNIENEYMPQVKSDQMLPRNDYNWEVRHIRRDQSFGRMLWEFGKR